MSKRRKPPEGGDYEVGYGRPPAHSRFPKGTSGNPRGRPKKTKSGLGVILAEKLEEKVSVREGGKVRKMTRGEIVVQTLINGAMKGDAKAQRDLWMLAEKLNLLGTAAPQAAGPVLVVPGKMTMEDWLAAAEKQQAPHRENCGE